MDIPLVEPDDVKTRGGKTKGEKYAKYAQAVAKNLRWFKERIEESPDGKIRIRMSDVKKELGSSFDKLKDKAVYWGLRFVLFHEGLVVETGTHIEGDRLLIIRRGTPDDKLPPSLSAVIEPTEDDMPEPGSEE